MSKSPKQSISAKFSLWNGERSCVDCCLSPVVSSFLHHKIEPKEYSLIGFVLMRVKRVLADRSPRTKQSAWAFLVQKGEEQ